MGDKTAIQWTDATMNTTGGCDIASPGCIHCYAQDLAASPRLRTHPLYAGTTKEVKGRPVFNGHLTELPPDHPTWRFPVTWRGAKNPVMGEGNPSLIFVGDMSDLFHEKRALDPIDRTVAAIAYSRHVGQLLTKRSDIMADYFFDLKESGRWFEFKHPVLGEPNFYPIVATFDRVFLPRFWLGFSTERQKEFDDRWPAMKRLAQMEFVIFVSIEPMIGPVVLPDDFLSFENRVWVIVGGESGPSARPFNLAWARALVAQCRAARVPCFVKQLGSHPIEGGDFAAKTGPISGVALRDRKGGDWSEWPAGLRVRQFPEALHA